MYVTIWGMKMQRHFFLGWGEPSLAHHPTLALFIKYSLITGEEDWEENCEIGECLEYWKDKNCARNATAQHEEVV